MNIVFQHVTAVSYQFYC